MTVFVPTWLIVAVAVLVGVPAILFVLLLAVVGWMVLKSLKGPFWR